MTTLDLAVLCQTVGYGSVWFVVAIGLKSPLFRNVTPRHWVIGFQRFETTKGLKVQEIDTTILEEEINMSGDKCPGTRRHVQEEPKPHVLRYESPVTSHALLRITCFICSL